MKLYINHVGEEMMKKMIMLVALMGLFSANIQAFPSGSVAKAKCINNAKTEADREKCRSGLMIAETIASEFCKFIDGECTNPSGYIP